MNLLSTGRVQTQVVPVSAEDFKFMRHGILMFTSWGIFGLLMCCSNRWCHHLHDKIQAVHTLSGLLITFCTGLTVITMLVNNGLISVNIHTISGIIMMVGTFLLTFNGFYTIITKDKRKWNT